MTLHRLRRACLVLVVLAGALYAGSGASLAQGQGAELVEAVTVEAVGDDAFVSLTEVEAFSPDGGEAIFEPGTDQEERFTYTRADTDTNRLFGLARTSPRSHDAGTFVAALPAPSPTPTSEPSPSDPGGESEDNAESSQEPAASESETPSSSASEQSAGGTSCATLLGEICNVEVLPTCTQGPICEVIANPLDPIGCSGSECEILDDPCGAADSIFFGNYSLSKRIVEPCMHKRTVKHRIRARGWANDGPDEGRDSAKATARLYCPGTSAESAEGDAAEYAESWLTDE